VNIKNIAWWLLFFPVAITIQRYIPGLDALLIGLIIVLQEARYKDLIWLLPAIIILQEGMGSREFGGTIAWYSIVMIFFIAGHWLFEVRNLFFVFSLSVFLGIAYFILAYTLAPLQELDLEYQNILIISLYQAIFIPLAWWVASLSRRSTNIDEEKV